MPLVNCVSCIFRYYLACHVYLSFFAVGYGAHAYSPAQACHSLSITEVIESKLLGLDISHSNKSFVLG